MARERPGSALPHIHRLFAEGSLSGFSDGQLLDRYFSRKDELAFETLIERHAGLVLGVCRRSLDEPGQLDDAFQATFLVLARRSRALRDQDSLGNWLFGVARRVCAHLNREGARRRKHEHRAAKQRSAREASGAENDDRGAAVYAEIERLPSAFRLPVVLCLLEGKTRAEAADALHCSEGAVRGRLARARILLRSRLIRRGIAPAAALAVLAREATAAGAVPRGLIEGTTRVATHSATGRAAALTQGVIRTMLLKKLALSAAVLGGALLVALAAIAALVPDPDQAPAVAAPRVAEAPSGSIPLDDPGKAAVHGRVVAPDGTAVAGARVWVDARPSVETRTDADGHFRLGPIKPNYRSLNLMVDASGFALLKSPHSATLTFPGVECDLGNIQVDPGRIFTGQVLDGDGTPRLDATIELRVSRNSLGHSVDTIGPSQTMKADAGGRFRTAPLPVGHLALTVQAPERQLVSFRRTIGPGGVEDLGTIRLEQDVPLKGVVKDEEGKPIAGARVSGSETAATTDAEGRFALRGFGPNPSFQSFLVSVEKPGYERLVRRLTVNDAGIVLDIPGGDAPASQPVRELAFTLKRRRPGAWIEGRAVDADTGQPVRIEKVVVFDLEPSPSGEAIPREIRSRLEQPEFGRFRAFYPRPGEFRLTLSAAGYEDAEVLTPRVAEVKTIPGIVAHMKKATGAAPATPSARRTITGTVTRAGQPIKAAWIALWTLTTSPNALNAPIMRGRTAVGPPRAFAAPIRDGAYTLDVPFPHATWYIVVEEPGFPLTQVGPIAVTQSEKQTLDIACTEGGRIQGKVKGVPPGWEGNVWVVAFSKTAVREEARVARDGTFSLPPLPPGEYGVKVGHDAFDDAEVHPGPLPDNPLQVFKETADPWKRAKRVSVAAGQQTMGVELEFPAQ